MKSRRSLAIVSVIVLMIVWGSTFVVTKAAGREIAPLALAALRFLTASLVLIPIAWMRMRSVRVIQPLPWGSLLLMALTGISAFAVAFTFALVYGSASQGAMIYAALPAAIALSAVLFLRERLSRRRLAGITLSIAGVALLIGAGESDVTAPAPLVGAAWMLAAVIVWTAYTVVAKRLAGVDHVITIAVVSTLGTLVLIPLALIELSHSPWTNPSLLAWLEVAFLGVVASALAYVVYGRVLRELDASVVGAYANLDPIVGVLTAVVFLGETLHLPQIAGGLIAFAGMYLASGES